MYRVSSKKLLKIENTRSSQLELEFSFSFDRGNEDPEMRTIMLTLQESIRPSADLRNHYAEISKQCKENKEAVIITVNGRGDTVSLSYEEYKNMKARIELLEVLAGAEDDVKNGRVAQITETFDDLRKMLQEG